MTSSVGIRVDFGTLSEGSEPLALTPRRLDEFLRALPESDAKPLVILAPPLPKSPFEAALQLLMRNGFAAELFRLGHAPVVLATGFVPVGAAEGLPGDLLRAVSTGVSIGEILAAIRGSRGPSTEPGELEDVLFSAGTALFTHDPDTRISASLPPAASAAGPHGGTGTGTVTGTGIGTPAGLVTRTVYALLVAIDAYPPPLPALAGCLNDIAQFREFLEDRIGRSPGVNVALAVLANGDATRSAVVDAFRHHLGRAGKGDVALFYFCGHGSLERRPEEFWNAAAERIDETLVFVDSRHDGSWDLAGCELDRLIEEVSARGPHVALILDCGHSGSGTRAEAMPVRRAPADRRRRPAATYFGSRQGPATGTTGSRFVRFSACHHDQDAHEHIAEGVRRGVLSSFLLDALKGAGGVPTYRDLFTRTTALITALGPRQSPVLESTNVDDLDAVFLYGAIQPAPASFPVTRAGGQWTLHAGVSHGVPAPYGSDVARVALFPFDAPADALRDPSRALATGRIVEVATASSTIAIDGEKGAELPADGTFKAVVISLPTPRVAVAIEAADDVRGRFRQQIETSLAGAPSVFIQVAPENEPHEFRVVVRGGRLDITRSGDDRPLAPPCDGQDEAAVRLTVQRLEHIARWVQTVRLTNPSSSIQPGEVKLAILVDGKEISDRDVRLEYHQPKDGGERVAPEFQISVTNTGQRVLHCALLDLTQTYRIDSGMISKGCVRLEPGQVAWAGGGEPMQATIPDALWRQGVIEYKDILKLIASTRAFDVRLLEQPPLDRAAERALEMPDRNVALSGTLNRQLRMVQTRDVYDEHAASIDDWQTADIAFTTVRPAPDVGLPAANDAVSLAPGVTLHGHPSLAARARLSTEALATRGLGHRPLPRLLAEDPAVCVPFVLAGGNIAGPGLSVLELTGVRDPEAVTAENPLRITASAPLARGEHVLAVLHDGEFFLPVGCAKPRSGSEAETTIAIDFLPPPAAGRSEPGAVSIFLEKITNRSAGSRSEPPRLGAAVFPPDRGAVVRIAAPDEVRKRASWADRILLLVHGIAGGTQPMCEGIRHASLNDGRPLAEGYDLVMTFDYDPATTGIAESARMLGSALDAAGLGAGHARALDIVAHSTGGLVARRLIASEGRQRDVRKLVMLGTPNGGLFWKRVAGWARLILGLGLNELTAMIWPAAIAGTVATLMEEPDAVLDEVAPGAQLIHELENPAFPSVVIAGTASVPPACAVPDHAAAKVLGRLLDRLAPHALAPDALASDAAARFLVAEANDLAATVASMQGPRPERGTDIEVRAVPSDHVSYFSDPDTLEVLAGTLEVSSLRPRTERAP